MGYAHSYSLTCRICRFSKPLELEIHLVSCLFCMSHRSSNLLLKLRLICHFYHLICPPNQLLYFISPSQLHPSSCSNQKDSSWTPSLSHLYSIISSIIYLSFVFILCFPKLGPKLLQLSSSSLPSMSLLI